MSTIKRDPSTLSRAERRKLGIKLSSIKKEELIPEAVYQARCKDCGARLNTHRGFTDGREYDYKNDPSGVLCVECDENPKLEHPQPPTEQQIEQARKGVILANLTEIEEATKANEIPIIEAFGLALQNMKADIEGKTVELWTRQKVAKKEKDLNALTPALPPVDERKDVIVGLKPGEVAP